MSKRSLGEIGSALERAAQPGSGLPPVDSWNPSLSGDIDIVIARDGTWYHEGSPIRRQSLVKLFSSILKREGDEYFLVSPVEKWRLQVEDVPFIVVALICSERESGYSLENKAEYKDRQILTFETNVGDCVCAGSDNPIRVEVDIETGEPKPYLRIRQNLDGRISRAVYYQLADLAQAKPDGDGYEVSSCGVNFELR